MRTRRPLRTLLGVFLSILFMQIIVSSPAVAEEKQYAPLSIDNYEETFTVSSCTLRAMRMESVTFAEANTYFKELLVEDGQYVEKGQVLATFEVQRDQSAIQQARISLRRSIDNYVEQLALRRDELKKAQSEVDDMWESIDKEIAQLRVDQMETALQQYINQQQYQFYLSETSLREMEEHYTVNELKAPISGIVFIGEAFKYKEGDPIRSLTMKVADPQSVRVVVDNGIQFHYGMDVTIRYGIGNTLSTYHGVICSAENLLPALDLSLHGVVPESNAEAPVIIDVAVEGLDLAQLFIEMNDPKAGFRFKTFEASVTTRYVENVLILNPRNAILESGEYSVMIQDGESVRKQKVIYGLWNRRAIWVLGGIDAQTKLAQS